MLAEYPLLLESSPYLTRPPSTYHMKIDQLNSDQPKFGNYFLICISQLPKSKQRFSYLDSDYGQDYLGQCLTQLGYNVEGKHRLPSDLGLLIPPFTIKCRDRIIDSQLTISIAQLDLHPEDTRHSSFVKLMNTNNYNVKFVF